MATPFRRLNEKGVQRGTGSGGKKLATCGRLLRNRFQKGEAGADDATADRPSVNSFNSEGMTMSGLGLFGYLVKSKRTTTSVQVEDMGLPVYKKDLRKAGDILFQLNDEGELIHTAMTASDTTKKVHSDEDDGVIVDDLKSGHRRYIVYRINEKYSDTAYQAAKLAEGWNGKVKYSDFQLGIMPGGRGIGAVLGLSYFGKGAQARLLKYMKRENTPKNVICSEMCILAYQLSSLGEKDPAFIMLDAKHSTPPTLMEWLDKNWAWERVAAIWPNCGV
jgi:hypothetical protein